MLSPQEPITTHASSTVLDLISETDSPPDFVARRTSPSDFDADVLCVVISIFCLRRVLPVGVVQVLSEDVHINPSFWDGVVLVRMCIPVSVLG